MTRSMQTRLPVLLMGLAMSCLGVDRADAQFLPGAANPYTGPAANGAPMGGVGNPYTLPPMNTPNPQLNPYIAPSGSLSNTPSPAASPYFTPGPGYYFANPFMFDPSGGGYLRGAADVIDSQGRYLLQRQEAFSERERARQARIETNTMLFDEIMRRRDLIPTPEELRQKANQQLLEASLNNPPSRNVVNGTALNSILDALRLVPNGRKPSSPVTLPNDVVEKINLSKGKYSGNLGLLRDKGKVEIPTGLRQMEPAEESAQVIESVQARTKEGYDQAVNTGRVNPELIKQLESDARTLERMFTVNAPRMSFTEHSEVRQFLNNLESAVRLLGDSDAAEFLQGRYVLRGNDVGQLVDHMTKNGLTFAPAVNPGEDAAYMALHQALVQYFNQLAN